MSDVYVYNLNGSLYVNLTNRCCNSCEFCLRNSGSGIGGYELWLEHEPTAAEIISAMPSDLGNIAEIVFCGYGEPLYRLNEVLGVAGFAHSMGKPTRLNTNGLGSLINGFDVSESLAGLIDTVSVSLNYPDTAAYERHCKPEFENAYAAILEFVRQCVQRGIDTVVSVVDIIGAQAVEKCRMIASSLGAKLRVRELIT